jgi:DNA-binding NarL/FixJ family response regulator
MRIVICDAQTLFTEALKSLFEERGYDVVTSSTPQRAAEIVRAGGVDIAITELSFPSTSLSPRGDTANAAAVTTLVNADAEVRVIVLTAVTDPVRLREALTEGAVAIAHKVQPLAELFQVVERVQAGEAVISGELIRAIINRAHADEQALMAFLTVREREVLGRLMRGQSTRQIAESMGVAYSTARTHVQSVLDKLGVHSRLEAAALAARYQVRLPELKPADGTDA